MDTNTSPIHPDDQLDRVTDEIADFLLATSGDFALLADAIRRGVNHYETERAEREPDFTEFSDQLADALGL